MKTKLRRLSPQLQVMHACACMQGGPSKPSRQLGCSYPGQGKGQGYLDLDVNIKSMLLACEAKRLPPPDG